MAKLSSRAILPIIRRFAMHYDPKLLDNATQANSLVTSRNSMTFGLSLPLTCCGHTPTHRSAQGRRASFCTTSEKIKPKCHWTCTNEWPNYPLVRFLPIIRRFAMHYDPKLLDNATQANSWSPVEIQSPSGSLFH